MLTLDQLNAASQSEFTALLDGVGASISFSANDNVAEFTARCLAKDVPLVVSLVTWFGVMSVSSSA